MEKRKGGGMMDKVSSIKVAIAKENIEKARREGTAE